MDISRPTSDFLPKLEGKSTGARLWKALTLLALALVIAAAAGTAGVWLIQLVAPAVPVYVGVLIGLVALVISLRVIAERYDWIMPWYYLLPAIIFLLTFALFPVVLTIVLAFTDYAGVRNGELNISS
ncbi:MAG: sugar ABC transporter permease, partial [Deinococcota bacterium]